GIDDFLAMPSHVIFIAAIYPIVGLIMARMIAGYQIWTLLFPLLAGFALVGHFSVLALYEVSRRRERNMAVSWRRSLTVLRSPAIGSIMALGLELIIVFLVWLEVAQAMAWLFLGDTQPEGPDQLLEAIFGTPGGWALLVLGTLVGFVFA